MTSICLVALSLSFVGSGATPMHDSAVTHVVGAGSFPANARFDYQIGGVYRPAGGVRIVDRDRSAAPAPGRYNICYVNAFQTQPQERSFWLKKHPNLLLRKYGKLVEDPDWAGEYLLDTSTRTKRVALLSIVGGWIDGCARHGFRAVEPDNLDSWTRSEHLLTKSDNLRFVALLAARAHRHHLLIAQKNASQLGSAGRRFAHLDFAIAEECQVYRECGRYTRVYGDRVIEIEYTDNGCHFYTAACAARGAAISIILRDRDVMPSGKSAYRYAAC